MTHAWTRYTFARLFIFVACLLIGWLVGLRDNLLVLLLVAATVSMLISLFALRGMRDQFSIEVADSVERRHQRKTVRRQDEVMDDAEDEISGTGR